MSKHFFNIMRVGFFALVFTACSSDENQQALPADLMLMYQETEPGIDAYMTRVLVNKDYMRLDEGGDQTNYTLYDRKENIIYTISHEEKTIMQVKPLKSDNKITRKLVMDAKKIKDKDIPLINGQQPIHYELKVNDTVCTEVFVIDGIHKEAVEAMQEFNRLLASVHLKNMENTPDAMQDDCFLAHHILSPSRSMQFGFPILEQSANGMSRLLVDFDSHFNVAEGVYDLPEGYRRVDMAGVSIETGI